MFSIQTLLSLSGDSWIEENLQDANNYEFCECLSISKNFVPYIMQRLEALLVDQKVI